MKLNAVIIDDEDSGIKNISYNIENFCFDKIAVQASTTDPVKGIELVKQCKPDVLFLDIQMPVIDGFEVLERLTDLSFFLVFTTAYSQYGIRAVKASAFDYLLKPIDPIEFKETVDKMHKAFNKIKNKGATIELNKTALLLLNENLKTKNAPKHIMVPQQDYMVKLDVSEILYIEADVNYAFIYIQSGKKIMVARTLKSFEEILDKDHFIRIHKSFLVNKQFVKETRRKQQYFVMMKNDALLPIARRRVKEVLEIL